MSRSVQELWKKPTKEEVMEIKKYSSEWYLYHSRKNEDALVPVIIISILVFFIKPGVVWSVAVWMWYFDYCTTNNNKLNKDPWVLEQREIYEQIRKDSLVQYGYAEKEREKPITKLETASDLRKVWRKYHTYGKNDNCWDHPILDTLKRVQKMKEEPEQIQQKIEKATRFYESEKKDHIKWGRRLDSDWIKGLEESLEDEKRRLKRVELKPEELQTLTEMEKELVELRRREEDRYSKNRKFMSEIDLIEAEEELQPGRVAEKRQRIIEIQEELIQMNEVHIKERKIAKEMNKKLDVIEARQKFDAL